MSSSHADSQSAIESDASSATFASSNSDASDASDVPETSWELDPPEIEPQDDYDAIVDLLTEWAYGHAFAFVKERSWQDQTGATYRVKLMCDRACKAGRRRTSRGNTRNTSSSKLAPACPFRITVSALKATAGKWTIVSNQ